MTMSVFCHCYQKVFDLMVLIKICRLKQLLIESKDERDKKRRSLGRFLSEDGRFGVVTYILMSLCLYIPLPL